PPSTFRSQPNDSRTVRFPPIFALRVDFVRSQRIDAHDLQLLRTHEYTVNASITHSSPRPHASMPPNPPRSRTWMNLLGPRSRNAAKLTAVFRIIFRQDNPQKS